MKKEQRGGLLLSTGPGHCHNGREQRYREVSGATVNKECLFGWYALFARTFNPVIETSRCFDREIRGLIEFSSKAEPAPRAPGRPNDSSLMYRRECNVTRVPA